MSISLLPGTFSQAMYGQSQAGLLETAFNRLLGVELDGSRMDARKMGEFATQVTHSISDHYEEFSASLPFPERQNLERMAQGNGIGTKATTIEYLSNAYLFRTIRDYFDLPPKDAFPQMDAGGFLVFTLNGSIVASPPEEISWSRTFHYSRMPSRTNAMETSSRTGQLLQDIALGHRLKTTAFTSSAIRRLLYVPLEQARLFEEIRENSIAASHSVSLFVTRGG